MSLKRTTVVTLSTSVNLLLTLGNQVVMAYLFGAGTSMDAFLACGAVPFVVLNLAIGDLGYVLIPLLMQYAGTAEVRRAIGSTFTAVLAISTLVAAAGALEHRTILHLTTASTMPTATFQLAASLAPVMWGIIGLTIASSYLTGLHHYYRFFTAAAITLALPYLGLIVGGLAGARHAGIHAVVWGWFAGTLLRTVVLYLTLKAPRPTLFRLRHSSTAVLLRSLFPLGVALLPFAALPMIDVFWASRLPVGSISFLGYSTRIAIAITSIVVQGLSVVLFPDLSEDARQGRFHVVQKKSQDAIQSIFAFIVPLVSLAYLLDSPLLTAFLQRGKFTSSSSQGVLCVLPYYLLGAIPMAMMNIISRTYFALRDYRTPALTGLLGLGVYVGLAGSLVGRYSYVGIGIAYAVFWLFLFLLQTAMLGRKVGALLTGNLFGFFLKIMACAAVAIPLSNASARLLPQAAGTLERLPVIAISFVAVYILLSMNFFYVPQYASLMQSVYCLKSPQRLAETETEADLRLASSRPPCSPVRKLSATGDA